MKNHPTILCDVDHTVSDAGWRDHLLGGDWDAYHAGLGEDKPIRFMRDLLWQLYPHYHIIGITARPEKWRQATLKWLVTNVIPMYEVLMRPDANYQPAHELKLFLARLRFGFDQPLKDHVAFVIDDRDDVCAAFLEQGVPALKLMAA